MFEKEAKKWVKEHTEIEYKASYGEFPKEPSAIKSFKEGAELGYNKAIVEIKDAYEGNGNFSAWFESYLEGKNV